MFDVPGVPTFTLEAWQAEALRRGNGDKYACRFLCPLCGNVATALQFRDAGALPDRVAQECIGRVIGAKGSFESPRPVAQPCDWAAFGLFGTLNSGAFVDMPGGKRINVFSFAE